MVTYSESPKTLEEIQATIQKHLGDPGRKKPNYTIDRPSKSSNRLCFVSYATGGLRYEIGPDLLQIVAKSWRLHLNLEPFTVKTEFAKDRFCLWIESSLMTAHRYFSTALRELTSQSIQHSIPGFCAPSEGSKTISLPTLIRRSHRCADGLPGGGRGAELVCGDDAIDRGGSPHRREISGLKRKQQMLGGGGRSTYLRAGF